MFDDAQLKADRKRKADIRPLPVKKASKVVDQRAVPHLKLIRK